ncbi:MAG: 2-amino-4-hydroxy-6-hydroxymethyldihydropteridine diphosphokinase [bacterium]|nr:2-amino-4-hydroxy-6-hydroxymethyldihydropteridine diphosphokinase [bacterium]
MDKLVRYLLGLGSNLGDRLHYLQSAVAALGARQVTVLRASSVYETSPVGAPEAQPPYLNAVIECVSFAEPPELLATLSAIEQEHGRTRTVPNAARTLDIDLLLAEQFVCSSPGLTIPHPRLHERLFVLAPLRELVPELLHPVLHQTIEALYHACRAASRECVRLFAPPFTLWPPPVLTP